MNKIIKIITSAFFLFTIHFSLFASPVSAVCPVCTVAVGAGLGVSRYLGIDDSITGIWVGGLMVSITLWTVDWLKKKDWKFTKSLSEINTTLITFIFYILITYPPLWYGGIIGHPFNTMLGIDKLIFGSVLGVFSFFIGVWADKKVRKLKGQQLFNYQKVVFPVTALTFISLVVYFYGGYIPK